MKNKVAWFEIPASDFQKAKKFYETVFDWKIDLWGDEGAMATTTAVDKDQNPVEPGGINGGFYKRKSKDEHPSVVVQTESIDKTLKAIETGGGKVVTPKHSIKEWGFMADFVDPEGNVVGLWESPRQRDEKDHEDHVCQKIIDQTARRAPDEMKDMPTLAKIVPFLWYAKEAEQAAPMGFRSVLQVAVRLKKNRPR